jgi:hypothetical protein
MPGCAAWRPLSSPAAGLSDAAGDPGHRRRRHRRPAGRPEAGRPDRACAPTPGSANLVTRSPASTVECGVPEVMRCLSELPDSQAVVTRGIFAGCRGEAAVGAECRPLSGNLREDSSSRSLLARSHTRKVLMLCRRGPALVTVTTESAPGPKATADAALPSLTARDLAPARSVADMRPVCLWR